VVAYLDSAEQLVTFVPYVPKLKALVAFPRWPRDLVFPDDLWSRPTPEDLERILKQVLYVLTGPSAVHPPVQEALNKLVRAAGFRLTTGPLVGAGLWRAGVKVSLATMGQNVCTVTSTAWHPEMHEDLAAGLRIRGAGPPRGVRAVARSIAPHSWGPSSWSWSPSWSQGARACVRTRAAFSGSAGWGPAGSRCLISVFLVCAMPLQLAGLYTKRCILLGSSHSSSLDVAPWLLLCRAGLKVSYCSLLEKEKSTLHTLYPRTRFF